MSTQVKKVKLIVTLGPATKTEAQLRALKERGVDFVRINMSHSTIDDLRYFLGLAQKVGIPFIIDTEGSQVRTGEMQQDAVELQENQEIKIFAHPKIAGTGEMSLKPANVMPLLEKGDILHVDFNHAILRVTDVSSLPAGYIRARAVSAGKIGRNKAVVVDSAIPKLFNLSALSKKDYESIRLGLEAGAEHVAASFIRDARFVEEVRKAARGRMRVISKIECVDALNNLDEIVEVSDAVYIDRGDLSKEVPIEKIPLLQKQIIGNARKLGKEAFVATNFLESMIVNRGPTRAEVNDAVNTILDGASGLVLSAETAVGLYPMKSVNMMKKLIVEGEKLASGTADPQHSHLIAPHGGALVDRMLREIPELDFRRLPQIQIDDETHMDLEQIAIGTFSPLEGFMTKTELASVLDDMRLPGGVIWPLPIVLNVGQDQAKNVETGQTVVLNDATGQPVGLLHVKDKYTFDLDEFARKLYGTLDEKHPGVRRVRNFQPWFLGGKIDLIRRRPSEAKEYELTPRQVRRMLSERGWSRVVGFHTRNVIHKGHEYIQLAALDQVSGDGLFVHPVVGKKKPGDYHASFIIRAYEKMMESFYPKDTVVLGTFATYSRYAGPREALFTAICRQNFGCSHFIVGRDHTGVGSFYPPTASHGIFDQFPELGIQPIRFGKVYYSDLHQKYIHEPEMPDHPEEEKAHISGTEARKMMEQGKEPPHWYMRPEISRIIIDALKKGREVFVPKERKAGAAVWLTGLSGSGKSTIAARLKELLEEKGKTVEIIDGDTIRRSMNKNLDFSREGIRENNLLIAELARERIKECDFVLIPVIAPYAEDRQNSRKIIGENFVEVFVNCPVEICAKRDTKGLYAKAKAGELLNLIGVSPGQSYEDPDNPDIEVKTDQISEDEAAETILRHLEEK